MDIKHQRGEDMIIVLDARDMDAISSQGYCMDRNGLCGTDTKTWVRNDMPAEKPNVQIDGASDVMVYLPTGSTDLPVRIEQDDMDPYMDSDRKRLNFYFGAVGAIIVQAAN